jgi:pimeloyl-ACP methyl ester carboxylesterase
MNKTLSKDGTPIAFKKTGAGPAVILVDGAFCSSNFGPMPKLAPVLEKYFTVISYDRRARGESGDTKPYDVQREIEDIEALIHVAGGSAHLFSISSGAILAIRAAAAGLNITKLALLEPPFVGDREGRRPANAEAELKTMIAEKRRGDAVAFYLRKVMGLPLIITWILRLTPNWSKMKANADSLPYDASVCGDFNIPRPEVGSLTMPTIVIDSTKSPKILRDAVRAVADLLPNGRQVSLDGKIHDVPPGILVPVLEKFYNSSRSQ